MSDAITIALDVDSTIAATTDAVMDAREPEGHTLGYDDIESWDWLVDRYGHETFMDTVHDVWANREVDPLDESSELSAMSQMLSDIGSVDVVTHQRTDDTMAVEGKRAFLDEHNIEYGELRAVDPEVSKAELGYDIYIDDKPSLVDEVGDDAILLLRDQPYNRHVDPHYRGDDAQDIATALYSAALMSAFAP